MLLFVPLLAAPVPGDAGKKQKKRQPKASIINQAYVKIKKQRKKALDEYIITLRSLVEECADRGLKKQGLRFLGRVKLLVTPPKSRRKVPRGAGVGLDAEGERTVLQEARRKKRKSKPHVISETEKWIRDMRAKLTGKKPRPTGEAAQGRVGSKEAGDLEAEEESDLADALKELDGLEEDGDESAGETADGEGADPAGDSGQKKKTTKNKKKSPGRTVVKGNKDGTKKADEKNKEASREPPDQKKHARRIRAREERARKDFTKSVGKLARRAVDQRFPAQAFELLLWALRVDGDNEKLRKTVRQFKHSDKWYTPYELNKVKQGFKEHPEFGWVKSSQLKALKAGKVWYRGKWEKRDKVERLRQKWENAWTYDTEHFSIRTNAPLSDAVEFGREVERLYAFFYRMFVDFYSPAKPDAQLVFGGGMSLGRKKLGLHYYRSRESYIAEVKRDRELGPTRDDPLLEQSAGFYYSGSGKAYFYRGPNGPDLSTIYHEVTHQLFGETYNRGLRAPTWLVEAFGVFMEDPVIRGERLIAGAEPPPGIRKNNVRDINDFVKNFQNHQTFHGPLRSSNYATAGAVVHFFLLYRAGLYRKAFMTYAREAYRNTQDNSPTDISKLYEYLGITEAELQASWVEFNRNPDLFDF